MDNITFSADLQRFILPFSFDETLYDEVYNNIENRKIIADSNSYSMWTKSNDLAGEIDLYHYVESSVGTEKECLGNSWEYNHELLEKQQEKSNLFSFAVMDMDELTKQNPVPFDIDEIGLYLFKSGVGFIWYSVNYKNKTASDIIETNYVLKELARESLSKIYKNKSGLFQFQDFTRESTHYTSDAVLEVMDNYLQDHTKVFMAFRNIKDNKIISNRVMKINSEYECIIYESLLSLCRKVTEDNQKEINSVGLAEYSDNELSNAYRRLQTKINEYNDKNKEAVKCRNVKREKYEKESKYLKNKLSEDELEILYHFYTDESLENDIKYCQTAITSLTILRAILAGNLQNNTFQYFLEADARRKNELVKCCDKLKEFNSLRKQAEEFIQKHSETNNTSPAADEKVLIQLDELIERLNLYKIKCYLSNLGKLDQENELAVCGYKSALEFIAGKLKSILSEKDCYKDIPGINSDFMKIPDTILRLEIDDIIHLRDLLISGLKHVYKESVNNILTGKFPENQELIIFFSERNQADQLTIRKISNVQDKENKFTIKTGRYAYKSLFADYLSDYLDGIPITSFFSDRKTSTDKLPFRPDKALLYSYVYIKSDIGRLLDEQAKAGLIYRMGRCYSKNYEPNNRFTDLWDNSYTPFSYQTWFASREGCTNCVIATPDCFSGQNNYFGNEYLDRTRVEFYMYILVLQQFYGLLKANETISVISNNIKDNLKSKSNKLIESYVERMQIFRVKNVFSQVSPITHENGYFQYLQRVYQIDDYMQEINNELGAVNELLEKKANKMLSDKVRIFSLIGAAFVLIQTINNIIGIYNDPSFSTYYSSGRNGKLISLLFANEGMFLLSTLGLTIVICGILYFAYYFRKK